MVATTSDSGNDTHTPSRPNSPGSHSNKGIRKITCRERLRNIDLPAFPMLWKKAVEIIWNPTAQNHTRQVRSA